jgi:ABC-type transporter Mla subunit MlaD
VPPLIDQLLLPQKLAQRGVSDLRRIADAAVALGALATDLRGRLDPVAARLDHAVDTLDALRDEVAGLHRVLKPMSDDLDGVREAAEPLHGELSRQRESIDALDADLKAMGEELAAHIDRLPAALRPLQEELGDMRDVVEPLAPAAERVGRLAERMPGPGRRRD